MRDDQARELIERLESAFNKQLPGDTEALYISKLMEIPYSVGVKNTERAINKSKWFPKIAELLEDDDAGPDRDKYLPVEIEPSKARWMCFRQDKLLELSETEYWLYLHQPAHRARLENQWRQEFAFVDAA